MINGDLISADDFCTYHKVEVAFINSLYDFGLIEITCVENRTYIPQDELQKLEQLARMHYELNINMEGIDVVTQLLDKLKSMQSELVALKQRLTIYEGFQ
jgi:hypothetical protein